MNSILDRLFYSVGMVGTEEDAAKREPVLLLLTGTGEMRARRVVLFSLWWLGSVQTGNW